MSAPETTETDTDTTGPQTDPSGLGMTRTGRLLAIGGCALAVAVGGWAGATSGPDPAPVPTAGTTSTTRQDTTGHDMSGMHGMGDPGSVELWAVQSGAGDVVTDGSGRMLYRSAADGTSPPASRCDGTCTQEWRPVTVKAGQRPDTLGVADRSVGTLTRPDGTLQVTLAGSPLYTHRGDDGRLGAPVDAGGWSVVAPDGGEAGADGP